MLRGLNLFHQQKWLLDVLNGAYSRSLAASSTLVLGGAMPTAPLPLLEQPSGLHAHSKDERDGNGHAACCSSAAGKGKPVVLALSPHAQCASGMEQHAAPAATSPRLRPKSAKRRAAEALLAARYSDAGCSASSRPSAPGCASGGSVPATSPGAMWACSAPAGALAPAPHAPNAKQQRIPACSTPPELPAARRMSSIAATASASERAAAAVAASAEQQASTSAVAMPEGVRSITECPSSCSHPQAQGWCHHEVRLPHVSWPRVLQADPASLVVTRLAPGYERWQLAEGLQVRLLISVWCVCSVSCGCCLPCACPCNH